MQLNNAIIRIKNLRLRTYIGFKDEEMQNKQDVVINVHIEYKAAEAAVTDNVSTALNYRTITKEIIQLVENNRFLLLEKLTSDVLQIASAHSSVIFAEVEIDKPHALRFADSVSLTLSTHKQ